MTTITSSSGSAEAIRARRTKPRDVSDIISLFSGSTDELFGRVDVTYLLEKSNLALTLCNEKEVVIAHAAFLDYPNWDITDQSKWESFLHANYINNECTPLNTLFLHLFVAEEKYAAGCLQEIVRTAFVTVPELQFILLFVPADENLEPNVRNVFEKMTTAPGSVVDKNFTLLVCPRHRCHPQLHVRTARLEDYDDLTQIWTLKESCSEYFLADLLECQDEEHRTVVCEDGGTAVGFMSLCSQVNVSQFQECFDLGPFHGLCKPHPDVLKMPQEPSVQEGGDESNQTSQETERASSQTCARAGGREAAGQQDGAVSVSRAEPRFGHGGDTGSGAAAAPALGAAGEGAFHPACGAAANAFCIHVFCIDEKHETRSLDFLGHVFKLFPDKDFCVIVVPPNVAEFHLIQSFVRVVPLCPSQRDHELYVFHRAGLLKSFNVRRATTDDVLGVKMLIKTLNLNENILNDLEIFNLFRRDPDGTPVQAFVAEVLDQIVGISVIRDEMDIEYVRTHYNIEDFINFNYYQQEEHGHLCHFVLNPIFHHYTKHFLKEILRLAHKSSLYYRIYPQDMEGEFQSPRARSLTSALHYMVPVRPRRQIVYPLAELGIGAPPEQVSGAQLSYSLNHINRKLLLEPRAAVNTRIVVVGASDVGISFLETLVFCPHLKFNNLTLISTHGLPGKDLLGSKHRRFLINSHCFNDEDYAQMSLCSWVNVVVGKMTGIDRAAKYVVVSKERKVPYDYLVLCTGLKYQVPSPTGADISKLPTNREVTSKWPQRYTGQVPGNHFTLNDAQDCSRAARWLREHLAGSQGNVIVYGNTIDIYTTVEALLSLGIAGSRIHLVQPPVGSSVTCLNNAALEGAVQDALSRAGVSVHRDAVLARWGRAGHADRITWAAFTTDTKPFQLQCSAFFNFAYRRVDFETFKAISDAGLVFDGRLVIDAQFRTSDASIRAAGPLTKYSRRYYADEWTHSSFSSREVGFELATSMLGLFHPTCTPSPKPEGTEGLIPMYRGCKIKGGVLPGGYHFVHISKPEIPIRLDLELALHDHGTEMVTGEARRGNYFRMHVNKSGVVDSITCFSTEPVPVSNYACLYGQHERLLNDLLYRWNEGQIADFYSYFREPWSMAIYHDRFIDLKKELRQVLVLEQVPGLPPAEPPWDEPDEERPCPPSLQDPIVRYLRHHRSHLPMYAPARTHAAAPTAAAQAAGAEDQQSRPGDARRSSSSRYGNAGVAVSSRPPAALQPPPLSEGHPCS
ncbi:cilia- and flagella-associated protein 61 isoform X2 [Patagioenas fasciata]